MGNKVLKIGITGGIGSGKSLVCKVFSMLGIPVYDSDSRAKWIANFHPVVKKEMIVLFGSDAYLDGKLNTRYISEIVFKDKSKTEKINAIIHPKVGEDFNEWYSQQINVPYILKEAALLYESGSYKTLDKIIVVTAPLEMRIKRVLQRDVHRTESEVRAIINKQFSEEEKCKRADFLIYNNEEQLVIPQVVDLDKKFRKV
jgi:dephospho-CoA kinase